MSTNAVYSKSMTPRPTPVQEEIRQTRPFRSRGHEALIGLVLTSEVLKRKGAALLEPHGVTPQQYNVLRILRGAGKAGLPTLDIADRMIERTPGITRLLDRLERKGWVRRERCATDRRQVLCYISASGLKLLAALDAPVDAFDNASMAPLAPAEVTLLVKLLDRVRAAAR